ncbi:MAG TPA: SUMF1/EgtB/PvdO family nonheme iron enzyme [Candidatus Thiothrix moscowensis]|uniref:SUMF1/EgtB/PvdO family nonheme iron enzyme n=1 Tax=unclassified Thiothrix TaxID=2636184 RepID=UPI0025E6B562|nr:MULTISPECIES: SUMF1/EgtB/PvdO family nonheme iron enzyme [unclassified Thiothrix]HRJ51397.1 SUMF1/EgtB/PvdO family nonheme iron enzyme [Candidatus Thiothrix moscowensis]HRJ91548.1 SUMF1/EgtB/PvdO family nonheme iron enzyme [Candidatus Thiothrix moscowensis]
MPHAENGSVAAESITDSNVTVNNITVNGTVLSAENVLQREQHYLKRVMKDCAGLEWLSLMDLRDENSQRLELDAVYTALLTTTPAAQRDMQPEERQQKLLSALEVLNREQCLVLTGDPGSGKSAFVNYLTLCMAGENLQSAHVNLQTLTAPLPDEQGNPQTEKIKVEGKDEPEQREIRQAWEHDGLIPVRIILRDFSASAHFPAEQEKGDVCHLMTFLLTQLERTDCQNYAEILQQRLRDGKVLVMFDGLDEVPQAGDRRKRLVECVEGFARSYADCRLLVTCRPYAYRDPQWHIRGFAVSHLAPFTDGQIIRFIQRWYASLGTLDQEAAAARGAKLQAAVLRRSSLHDLAKRPLLLSLIAYLHAYRHELPERRADLYEKLLELLVNKWEKARFDAKDCDDARRLAQHSLAEFLQIGQEAIRRILERLAFRAHALQDAQQQETADISADDLILALTKAARSGGKNVDAWEVCDYLRDRVGILYQRGGTNEMDAVYTFPHRSFQEYLAAAYFQLEADDLFKEHEDCQSWQEVAAQLGTSDPDRWREVVLLAGGIDAQAKPRPVWDLVDALYPEALDSLTQDAAWGLRLAAEIMADNLNVTQVGRIHKPIFERIRTALPQALITPHLPAVERAAIGRYLVVIGDPRTEIMTVEAMAFVPIPAGKFWMGKGKYDEDDEAILSENPAGEYDLNYAYQMAKYPVTVAQFRQFVDATGFKVGDEDALRGVANTPVVWVSQAEAMQFCQWLTGYLHDKNLLGRDLCITLPDDAEWEKAARGGLENNPEPQRRYPWGNEISDEHLNYQWSIGQVTMPGIYPQGASPYGCEDMVGNVWEWTRSESGKYPYPTVGTEEWKKRSFVNGEAVCVLRGGAFYDGQGYVRAAVRNDGVRDARYDTVGFRCCVVPITLTSEASGR